MPQVFFIYKDVNFLVSTINNKNENRKRKLNGGEEDCERNVEVKS